MVKAPSGSGRALVGSQVAILCLKCSLTTFNSLSLPCAAEKFTHLVRQNILQQNLKISFAYQRLVLEAKTVKSRLWSTRSGLLIGNSHIAHHKVLTNQPFVEVLFPLLGYSPGSVSNCPPAPGLPHGKRTYAEPLVRLFFKNQPPLRSAVILSIHSCVVTGAKSRTAVDLLSAIM